MKRHHFFNRNNIIVGNKYGYLTILSITYKILKSGQQKKCVFAKCLCGNEIEMLIDNLVISPCPMCKKCLSINKRSCKVGDKFDKLTVIDFVYSNGKSCKTFAKCKCDCGNEKLIRPDSLKKNKTNDCGCVLNPNWKGFNEISGTYFAHIQKIAKNRNIEFNLSIEDIYSIYLNQNKSCALTGQPISFSRNYCSEQTASLDRIDSKKGYIINNIQLIHKDINKMKSDFDEDVFIKLCHMVSNYNK